MIKNKVLFLITKGNFGGAQRYVYDLATHAPEDFETVVACGDENGSMLKDKLSAKGIRTLALEGSGREIKIKNDFAVFRQIIKIMKEEKPQIVHLNSSKIGFLGSLAVLYCEITDRSLKPKTIFTAHGWAFNEKSRKLLWKAAYWLSYYLILILSDCIISVSEKTKKDVSFLPFVKKRIRVIYNGIGKFKTKNKKEARGILAEDEPKKIIMLSISELHNSKGIDIAINALARLGNNFRKKIIYCIIGGGEERENLEKLTEAIGLKDVVRFLGFIPDAKELLGGADLLLFPSRNENLPYAILEAGMAGVPVVATCVGGIPEIISDMQNGILVHPRDPREIAEAITYMIENPEKKKLFKEKMMETVASKFSLDQMVSNVYLLYKSLLSKT